MNRERAETYLRLPAEAELRCARTLPAGSAQGQWHSRGATGVFPVTGFGMGYPPATSQRASWRVAPVGSTVPR